MKVGKCDLRAHLGALLEQVPIAEGEDIDFSGENLPPLPSELATARLVIDKAPHEYTSSTHNRLDGLAWYATATTYRLLGLALLSKVFHREPRRITLHLTDPASQVRKLLLNFDQMYDRRNLVDGYSQWPDRFNYVPEEADFFGKAYRDMPDWAKPEFSLTNDADVMVTEADWAARDVVRLAGSEYGNVLFAKLLLNTVHPPPVRYSIDLETDFGFGGLTLGSAEVSLIMNQEDE